MKCAVVPYYYSNLWIHDTTQHFIRVEGWLHLVASCKILSDSRNSGKDFKIILNCMRSFCKYCINAVLRHYLEGKPDNRYIDRYCGPKFEKESRYGIRVCGEGRSTGCGDPRLSLYYLFSRRSCRLNGSWGVAYKPPTSACFAFHSSCQINRFLLWQIVSKW